MDGLLPVSLKPSRFAFRLYVAAVLLAVLSIGLSGLDLLVSLLLMFLLAWGVIRHRTQMPVVIGYADRQWWVLEQGSSNPIPFELHHDARVLAWLVVMPCRRNDNGGLFILAGWPDPATDDDLRRLRVFLRYGSWR